MAPTTVNFGRRTIGTTRTQAVKLTNNGPGVVTFGPFPVLATTGPFTAAMGTCGTTLAVGRSCNLSVSFTPTVVGPVTGTLKVTSNAVGSPLTVSLTGTGR